MENALFSRACRSTGGRAFPRRSSWTISALSVRVDTDDIVKEKRERRVTFHLNIPESVAESIRLPLPEVEPRLRSELALALYAQGILSFGKAAELAEVSRYAFADLAGERNIPRHYTAVELAEDLDYARGQ